MLLVIREIKFTTFRNEAEEVLEDCAQQKHYYKQRRTKTVQCENMFNVCVFELDDFEHCSTQAISSKNNTYIQAKVQAVDREYDR